MTENEIIENLDDIWTFGHEPTDKERLAVNKSIDLIQELQQYRAIGTVEECREARERQRGKKPIKWRVFKSLGYYQCPICGGLLMRNEKFCSECGQAIDWSK